MMYGGLITQKAIEKEYRRLSLLWHPDRNHTDSDAQQVFNGIVDIKKGKIAELKRQKFCLEEQLKKIFDKFAMKNGFSR